MSYIGQRPVVGRYIKLDQISSGFNGSSTSFSMTTGSQAVFPGTARNLLLSLGGVIQEPETDFTISGSTLVFTTAPVANTTFFAVIFGDMQAVGTPSDGTVLPVSIATGLDFTFNSITVGKGANSVASNTVLGASALDSSSLSGSNATAIGDRALTALTSGTNNTAVGAIAGLGITTGISNTIIGSRSGITLAAGSYNTSLGVENFLSGTGSYNIAIGVQALRNLTTGSNNTLLGYQAAASSASVSNEITIGNDSVTKFRIPGINVVLKDNGGTPSEGHVLTVDSSGEAAFAVGGVTQSVAIALSVAVG